MLGYGLDVAGIGNATFDKNGVRDVRVRGARVGGCEKLASELWIRGSEKATSKI